jgi:hypothetical protein
MTQAMIVRRVREAAAPALMRLPGAAAETLAREAQPAAADPVPGELMAVGPRQERTPDPRRGRALDPRREVGAGRARGARAGARVAAPPLRQESVPGSTRASTGGRRADRAADRPAGQGHPAAEARRAGPPAVGRAQRALAPGRRAPRLRSATLCREPPRANVGQHVSRTRTVPVG